MPAWDVPDDTPASPSVAVPSPTSNAEGRIWGSTAEKGWWNGGPEEQEEEERKSKSYDEYFDLEHPKHGCLSWTVCYHDQCSLHCGDKAGSNFWPSRKHALAHLPRWARGVWRAR